MTDTNPKNANAHRKQRETSMHRVIDRHRPGKNDASSMLEIRSIVGRAITEELKKEGLSAAAAQTYSEERL